MKTIHHARVYYEDTDAGGIVYYANYLRFLERGRTELLRSLGHSQEELLQENIAFAVRSAQIEYLLPARLDDLIAITTEIESVSRAQIFFSQCIEREGTRLLDAKIRIACINPASGKPIGMPGPLREQFTSLIPSSE